MKHYYDTNGNEFPAPPDPFRGRSPMRKPDGSYDDEAFVQMGGAITEDGEPSPEEEFAASAAKFRALCDEIGAFIGDPSFTGGFEEVAAFQNSRAAQNDPITAHALALRWAELNEECKYKGSKSGLGQPEWFYRCWELAAEERPEA